MRFEKINFICTVFLSAFLLFQVQPVIAKAILPLFGGAAAVWITCMIFFQTLLLLGYLYAHWSVSRLTPKHQAITHSSLIALSLLSLPLSTGTAEIFPIAESPLLQILLILLISVGLPYFLLSSTSPLMQAWHARTHPGAGTYRLFALSNMASLFGLLAYPFIIEPYFSLKNQLLWWSAAYILFSVASVFINFGEFRRTLQNAPNKNILETERGAAPSFHNKALWLLLAGCASALFLSVTSYLTQNVAPAPFLWILPLSIYLLSFVLCFDRDGWYRRGIYVWLTAFALTAMSYALVEWGHTTDIKFVISFFCCGLFICCMFCHGELAARRPAPKYLTVFYLMISAGGALGGIFVGLLAPKLFSYYFEFPIMLTVCGALLFSVNYRRWRIADIVCFAVIIRLVAATAIYMYSYSDNTILMLRNFYGTHRITEYNKGTADEYRILVHGAITHGVQFTAPDRRSEKNGYYAESSGIGTVLRLLPESARRIGIIGLGSGILAAYGQSGDIYRFYEIDRQVITLAATEFSFLSDSHAQIDIIEGDGRLSLSREPKQKYDLLIADAFSGDSVPVHLLTLDAVKLYFSHLKPDGILALHITNRNLDFSFMIERISTALGKHAVIVSSAEEPDRKIYETDWVLMFSDSSMFETHEIKRIGKKITAKPGVRLWTDDYSSLFQVLK